MHRTSAVSLASIERLPHRPPFLFISSIDEITVPEHGRATWTLTGDEEFFKGHFPGEPVVPGVLVAEALAQLAGLVADTGEYKSAYLASVNVRFKTPARPPAEIKLAARRTRAIGPLWRFDVEATSHGVAVAVGTITLGFVSEDATPSLDVQRSTGTDLRKDN